MSESEEDRALSLLDFPTVRRELCDLAMSEEGRALLSRQAILRDALEVEALLDVVGAWKSLLEEGAVPPPLQFPPAAHLLAPLAKEGAVGEANELAAIGGFVGSAGRLKSYLLRALAGKRQRNQADVKLLAYAEPMPDLGQLADKILSVLEADGTVKEDKIPELKRIRRQTVALRTDISDLSARHMNENRSLWQSDVPTQKDGRTVLPLKANYRGRVEGIVHEVSGSGATLFIEPFDVVEKNNELVRLENRYRQAVLRILRELSESVREAGVPLESLFQSVAVLDALHARARYALLHRCSRAERRERGIALRMARHPLLSSSAVPIDLLLEEGTGVLIITGPNTGGKTVALKTAGLLALMNQFGMEIPAADGSALPIFDAVYADIGDEQSIANSLSTFSAHMRNIARIVDASTDRSLVLLDEIASDTDPAEGSALAMALLDRLREIGALTLATTHLGVLKNYGLTTPGVINASVSLDPATLAPTYRIVMGVPGESHALEIAERNGIEAATIARARRYVDVGSTELSRAIRELAERQREVNDRLEVLEKERRQTESERRRLTEREEELRRREIEATSGELADLGRFLTESRRTLENLVRDLKEGEVTREKTRAVKEFLRQVEQKEEEGERSLAEERRRAEESAAESAGPGRRSKEAVAGIQAPIQEGQEVLVGTQRRLGTVIRRARGNRWVVAVKTLRLTVPESELTPARASSEPSLSVSLSDITSRERPAYELDVRGMRLEEALRAVEQQVDRALLSGLAEFAIIHGMGEGVLQEGIHRYLRQRSEVGDYFFSRPEAGGFGKTIVLIGPREQR